MPSVSKVLKNGVTYDICGEELETKAEIDGYYEEMTVGNAEQLNSEQYVEDSVPYTFRKTGGNADVGNREYDTVVGGSLAWNQLVNYEHPKTLNASKVTYDGNGVYTVNYADGDSTSARVLEFTLNTEMNHVYAYTAEILSETENAVMRLYLPHIGKVVNTNSDSYRSLKGWTIGKRTADTANNFLGVGKNGATTIAQTIKFRFAYIDLTTMFGPVIADYIYELETANTGAGVAWFKKYFPKSYYPYHAASIESVKVSAHETVGFNAYNPTTGTAAVIGGKQYQITGTYTAVSLDGTTITPDEDGFFTPSANGTLTVTGGDAADTCVHLVHSGIRNGDFEEYKKRTYELQPLVLRGVPKLDANSKIYYDGDTYAHDGTVTRRYQSRVYQEGDESLADAITDGTNTVVKLATPTTEQATHYAYPQICDDYGTERYVDYDYEQGNRDVEIPVGHNTQYPPNMVDKLNHLPSLSASGDGDYRIRQIGTQMTLVPHLETSDLPEPPTADGNYRLKCTVADGVATYTWEVDA